MEQSLRSNSVYELNPKCDEQKLASDVSVGSFQSSRRQENDHTIHSDLQMQFSDVQHVKQHSLNGHSTEEGLKKLDSFNRWMSKELGDVSGPKKSSSVADWDTIDTENAVNDSTISSQAHLDGYTLGPFLSQDQYFSIIDFSPNWIYVGSETKVLITGRFLKSQEEAKNCKWSCMFGEIEVPAEVIADGVLCCHAPFHKAGRVPFYITCSNRVACSELHEFEYRLGSTLGTDVTDNLCGNTGKILMRFERLLCLSSICPPKHDSSNTYEISLLSSKISSLLKEDTDEWDQMLKITTEKGISKEELQEKIFQKLLKEKLHAWLLQKAFEGGKGPSVLDKDGQGVLHFAANPRPSASKMPIYIIHMEQNAEANCYLENNQLMERADSLYRKPHNGKQSRLESSQDQLLNYGILHMARNELHRLQEEGEKQRDTFPLNICTV